jgi:D-inositol-3-phosphate glycosyltransferase
VVRDGVTGFLVEGHDAADHAERALQLLADRGLAERMGRAGVEHSMRFSWDVTARELRGVYEELLGPRA